jgi:hypothetical protein
VSGSNQYHSGSESTQKSWSRHHDACEPMENELSRRLE